MAKKYSEMPMPSKKDKKQADSEGFDLFMEEDVKPEETDMADEEIGELDLEDEAASPLADVDDEALLAEVKKRGLSLESAPMDKEV